jgi:hypothetical protein
MGKLQYFIARRRLWINVDEWVSIKPKDTEQETKNKFELSLESHTSEDYSMISVSRMELDSVEMLFDHMGLSGK